MTADEMHQNWLRMDCFNAAKDMMPGALVEDVIVEAKKIEQYVSGRNPKNVVKLVRGRRKK